MVDGGLVQAETGVGRRWCKRGRPHVGITTPANCYTFVLSRNYCRQRPVQGDAGHPHAETVVGRSCS